MKRNSTTELEYLFWYYWNGLYIKDKAAPASFVRGRHRIFPKRIYISSHHPPSPGSEHRAALLRERSSLHGKNIQVLGHQIG